MNRILLGHCGFTLFPSFQFSAESHEGSSIPSKCELAENASDGTFINFPLDPFKRSVLMVDPLQVWDPSALF